MSETINLATRQSQLEANCAGLLSLLTKSNQRLLRRNNNFEKPKVIVCSDDSIRITNWPYETIPEGDNFVEKICHDRKHLYAHGDSSGHKGIAAKQEQAERLQNNRFRMCISYTYSLIREKPGTQPSLIIRSITSKDYLGPRMIVGYITPDDLSPEQLEFINQHLIVDSSIQKDDAVALVRPMTDLEENLHFAEFIEDCAEEIRGHINKAYRTAIKSGEHGVKLYPDYDMPEAVNLVVS